MGRVTRKYLQNMKLTLNMRIYCQLHFLYFRCNHEFTLQSATYRKLVQKAT